MKEQLKNLLGEKNIYRLREIRNRFFPNEHYLSERREEEKVRKFYSAFVKQGDICFDIGANVGNRTKPLLDLGASVIAVEPQNSCRVILQMRFGKRIVIVPKGVGEKVETREFYVSNANTISSFSKDWIDEVSKERFRDYNWNTVDSMQMTTLDELIRLHGQPSFIKIDVEGFEPEVLRGLSKPVRMISFEYTVPEQTSKAIDCIERLSKIDPSVECNFCASDTFVFAFDKWKRPNEMKSFIPGNEFIQTGCGDIYVRSISGKI